MEQRELLKKLHPTKQSKNYPVCQNSVILQNLSLLSHWEPSRTGNYEKPHPTDWTCVLLSSNAVPRLPVFSFIDPPFFYSLSSFEFFQKPTLRQKMHIQFILVVISESAVRGCKRRKGRQLIKGVFSSMLALWGWTPLENSGNQCRTHAS